MTAEPTLPPEILPRDGRFGAGPSKVRPEQVRAVDCAGSTLLGTSHRQAPVRRLVGQIREGLTQLFELPEGHEVVLGNGGATAFWDAATFQLVRERAAHLSFGEFGAKFAHATDAAPHLGASEIITAQPGTRPDPRPVEGADVYAWPQNETSTGVAAPTRRPDFLTPDQLLLIDATSAAGGMAAEVAGTDAYYFSPQKNFASDGGLWVAALSPAALERIERISAAGRWTPASLDLSTAEANSRKNQTYNTPAIATLVMLAEQISWINDQGGLDWAAARTRESSDLVYAWAEASEVARPFVAREQDRSTVITTVDFDDAVEAARIAGILRAHGVVDVEPYRKLGRNQLRIATFTAIEPADVQALLACIDRILEQIL